MLHQQRIQEQEISEKNRKCGDDDDLKIVTNGGSVDYKEVSDLKVVPLTVHFNKNSLANILSFKHVESIPGVYITIDKAVEKII